MTKKYRFLDNNEIIREDDEVLLSDCETWQTPILHAVGGPYKQATMPPYRRKIVNENNEACEYVCKRFKLPHSAHVCELDRSLEVNGHTMTEVFAAGVEAERSRHEPKQSFQELIESEYPHDPGDEIYMLLSKWFNLCEKNRGYDGSEL